MTTQAPEIVQAYLLELVQARTKRWCFAWRQPDASYADLNDWNLYAQIRSAENRSADLLLDLTSFLSVVDRVNPDDTPVTGKFAQLLLPGSATAGLEPGPFNSGNAAWDLFAVYKADTSVDALLVQGPVTMDPSSTDMAGLEP